MRKIKRLVAAGSGVIAAGILGLSGIAGASSISNTGPGSYNVIKGGYGGSIHTTGPDSYNFIDGSQHGYAKKGHNKSCTWRCVRGNSGEKYDHDRIFEHGYKVKNHQYGRDCKENNHQPTPPNRPEYPKPHYQKPTHSSQPKYYPQPKGESGHKTLVKNTNTVNVSNNVRQYAHSGNASVYGNTHGSNATSGDATNTSKNTVSVSISNSPVPAYRGYGGSGHNTTDINTTGPGSHNYIGGDSHQGNMKITNTNTVNVSNNVSQTAKTGNATVSHNTHGGNATSGDASNYSSNNVSINISN